MACMKALGCLGTLFNIGHYGFGIHPYYWDKEKKQLCMSQSTRYKIIFWAQICQSFLYQIFLVSSTVRMYQSEGESVSRKLRTLYMAANYFLANVGHLLAIRSPGYHTIINNFIKITQSFEDETRQEKYRDAKEPTGFVKIAGFTIFVMSTTTALGCIRSPNQPHLLTSMATEPGNLKLWIRILIAFVHFRIHGFQCYPVITLTSVVVCYIHSVLPMIKHMQIEGAKTLDDKQLRLSRLSISSLCKYYTQLRVLQSNFNAVFGILILGLDITCLFTLIMNFSQAIILDSVRSLIIGLCVTYFATQAFLIFGQLHEVSNEMLARWKMIKPQPKWFVKYRKACTSQRMTIGSFFYIDRGFILTFLQIVVSKVVDIIVTYSAE